MKRFFTRNRLSEDTMGIKFKKRLALLLFVLIAYTRSIPQVQAQETQNITVSGQVMSDSGESLPGVTVTVKGRKKVTVTDLNGRYSLDIPKFAVLEFSFVGFEKQEVPVNSRTKIDITLISKVSALNEVVVVGYGTISKSDYNGSSSTVKLDRTNENKVISVPEALQGKIAGVQILNNTGEPGSGMSFNIRGSTSITGSNQPLIVIDGQPIESDLEATTAGNLGQGIRPADPLAAINPSDIASIEILKDASSTAIYGSRGANGVVLITTKTGGFGNDKVSYTSRFDVSSPPKKLSVLNAFDYLNARSEGYINDGLVPEYTAAQIDSVAALGSFNWQDLVYRDAFSQDHQLTFSGREEKSSYYLTANYADQNGILKNAGFQRGGVRLNYNRNVSKKLKISLKNYYSLAVRDFGQQSEGTGIFGISAVAGAIAFNPINSPYSDDGSVDETYTNNPLTVVNLVQDRTYIRTLISNFNAEYSILKNLTYKLSAGINDLHSKRQAYLPTGTFQGNQGPNGVAGLGDNSNSNYVIDNLLTYKKIFNKKHSLNAVLGYSYQAWKNEGSSVTNADFPSNTLTYYNFSSANAYGRTETFDRRRALASEIGRINYAYDRRYSLTLTGRYDTSSKLAEGQQGDFFPSIGLGWNVSNEKFFKNATKFVSSLKLRGSYGVAGNQNIAIGATKAKYNINTVVTGAGISPGYIIQDFENPNLKWEKTKQYNLGADFGFMKDKLTLTVDLYTKNTTDLLINLSLPGSSGFNNYFTNVGEVNNRGIDVESNYNILNGKFKWTASANFSVFDNNVKDIGASGIIYGRTYIAAGQYVLTQSLQVAKPGYPISSFWGYKTAGIYQNQTEIDNDPSLINDSNKPNVRPGDIKYVDDDGDGQIDEGDKTVIGKPNADFTYGVTNDFSYKGFSLGFNILGSKGNQLINLNRWVVGANAVNTNFNLLRDAYEGRWQGEGTSNLYPRLSTSTVRLNQRFPDWMVEDASFIRLQYVNLGYDFKTPKNWKIGGLRAFINGTNLITITPYTGYDPNINAFGNQAISSGTDFGTLPQSRTFSAGFEITL